MDIYGKIGEYKKALPNFIIAFTLAKYKDYFHSVYHKNQMDVLQSVAYCCLVCGDDFKELNRMLSREIYYLWKNTRTTLYPISVKRKSLPVKSGLPKKQRCDLCGKRKNEYLRKSIYPEKRICGACYQRLRREDKWRNSDTWSWRNATKEKRKERNEKIIQLSARGNKNKEIAKVLNISSCVVSDVLIKNNTRQRKTRKG